MVICLNLIGPKELMEKELREFDSTGEWFAHVTPDNRLRVIYYFFEKKKKK